MTAFGPGVAYATKAFLCKAMASLAVEEGMWLDVSTGGELAVALAAGVPAGRLVFHGNNKSDAELRAGTRAGSVGSSSTHSTRSTGSSPGPEPTPRRGAQSVLIRVTPGVEAHTHEYVMTGQEDSKFGFGLASGAADAAVEALRGSTALRLVGVHAHIGSQIFRVDVFAKAIAVLAPFLRPAPFWELCVGGGLGVAYLNDEQAPSITEWAATTALGVPARPGSAAAVRVTAEPGRSIVATAGMTLYRVGTIKDAPRYPHLCVGRRRNERQPTAGALRQRLRGLPAPLPAPPRPSACGWSASTASRVTSSSRTPAFPPTSPSATSSPPR